MYVRFLDTGKVEDLQPRAAVEAIKSGAAEPCLPPAPEREVSMLDRAIHTAAKFIGRG